MIEELNITKESADRANKAKSDFLSSMSHEIRTPLNAIVGFSEALSEEEMRPDEKEEVNIITTSAINLLEIVNGILDISKIDAGKLEITNKDYILNNLINDALITAKRYVGDKKLDFKVDVDSTLPQVLNGDIVKIKSILTNLLINSVKYTESGNIYIGVDGKVVNDKCKLIINIEDSGKGIEASALPNLFTSYQLGDKTDGFDGSGLGVAVTKKLVELMGGKIHVKSAVGVGTSFIFTLEQNIIAKTSNEVEGIFAEELSIFDATGKKILVVDDNGVNLKVAKRLLKDYKVEVDLANSGKECLEKINSGNVYDLIMMYDFMPEMDGASTLSNLKLINGFNTPVVALTANNESGSRDKYISLGFNNYLPKPIAKEELNKILKEFLQ
jgi:CheY-like chemotaxis protein